MSMKMSAAKCPACRGEVEPRQVTGVHGLLERYAQCVNERCRWFGPSVAYDSRSSPTECLDLVAPLAYVDLRDRFPTSAEEKAHRERHGEGAGWMYRIVPGATYFSALGKHPKLQRRGSRRDIECYPHGHDGWPVRGPEGW